MQDDTHLTDDEENRALQFLVSSLFSTIERLIVHYRSDDLLLTQTTSLRRQAIQAVQRPQFARAACSCWFNFRHCRSSGEGVAMNLFSLAKAFPTKSTR